MMNKDRTFLTKFLITWIAIAAIILATALTMASFIYFVPHGVYILLCLASIAAISLVAWNIANG